MLGNFVRSRNPVTVIVKMECCDLDRRSGLGLPYAMRERDGSHRSDRGIDDRCGSGCATFVPMMESADLNKTKRDGDASH
jgi:hypothetical protein